ncbi:hypothetical protein BC832DRAFT_302336 [Gaertneriomyces semiglobifer]|nr:hypothetical protein BC832DRAFT_302336 [Gaertneriomyces semiglobifer]
MMTLTKGIPPSSSRRSSLHAGVKLSYYGVSVPDDGSVVAETIMREGTMKSGTQEGTTQSERRRRPRSRSRPSRVRSSYGAPRLSDLVEEHEGPSEESEMEVGKDGRVIRDTRGEMRGHENTDQRQLNEGLSSYQYQHTASHPDHAYLQRRPSLPTPSELSNMVPVISGHLYKLGGNQRWQYRLFRFDGVLFTCLSKRVKIPKEAHDIQTDFLAGTNNIPGLRSQLLKSEGDRIWIPKWTLNVKSVKGVWLWSGRGVECIYRCERGSEGTTKESGNGSETEKKRDEKTPHGMDLDFLNIPTPWFSSLKHVFFIRTNERTVTLRAKNRDEMEKWLFVLGRMCRVLSEDAGVPFSGGYSGERGRPQRSMPIDGYDKETVFDTIGRPRRDVEYVLPPVERKPSVKQRFATPSAAAAVPSSASSLSSLSSSQSSTPQPGLPSLEGMSAMPRSMSMDEPSIFQQLDSLERDLQRAQMERDRMRMTFDASQTMLDEGRYLGTGPKRMESLTDDSWTLERRGTVPSGKSGVYPKGYDMHAAAAAAAAAEMDEDAMSTPIITFLNTGMGLEGTRGGGGVSVGGGGEQYKTRRDEQVWRRSVSMLVRDMNMPMTIERDDTDSDDTSSGGGGGVRRTKSSHGRETKGGGTGVGKKPIQSSPLSSSSSLRSNSTASSTSTKSTSSSVMTKGRDGGGEMTLERRMYLNHVRREVKWGSVDVEGRKKVIERDRR